ncbi:MAG TPA: rRNA maturation RNase YbeY [Bacteroidetes bacterium]|nr:rRNA maturation RNase YbeY [Bacteroidota bacterium]
MTKDHFNQLIQAVSSGENKNFAWIEIVYVDEEGIVEVNKKFLDRNYVTDIITFSYSDESQVLDMSGIEGTIYMCNQRIIEQATDLGVELLEEYKRIFVHGLLHLCGYNDDTDDLKLAMSGLENKYIE